MKVKKSGLAADGINFRFPFKLRVEQLAFFIISFLIMAFSFRYYAPYHYKFLNSDHAIYALMSQSFNWPRDIYYWGQNRTGSIIPLICSLILKLIPVHPLYVCSIVFYVFLAVPAFIISSFLHSLWLKLSVFCIIFLPVSEYYSLILLGHPYATQLFCGTLFCFFFLRFDSMLSSTGNIPSAKPVPIHLSFLACWLFFLLGVWASEFNAILFVIPLAFIIHEPRKYFSKKNSPYFIHLLIALAVVLSAFIYLKSVAPADDRYDKTFFFNMADIKKEWSFLIHKIRTTLLFDDHRVLENWYYYFLLLLSFSIYFMRKPVVNARKMILVRSLFITGLISFILLFFSVWNLVSEIGVRYYIPVYLMGMTGLLILADEYCRIFFKLFTFLLISFFSVYFTWLTLIQHNQPGPLERFGEFSKLPKGTLIASYWSAYLINGVACYNLQSLPFQDEYVRNWLWRDIPLAEKNIYFIEDPVNRSIPLTDTIVQFEKTFVYSGNSYDCNGIRVKQYHHLTR